MVRPIKKMWMWAVLILIPIVGIDLLSAHFLYYYEQLGDRHRPNLIRPHGNRLAIRSMLSEVAFAAGLVNDDCPYSQPAPFFRHHAKLGWSSAPGTYDVFFCPRGESGSRRFRWTVTIEGNESRRATSFETVSGNRHLYIFGDSFVFGWGLNDENTVAWHLQDALRNEWEVLHFANAGYGNVHNLLQFRSISDRVGREDVLIFAYADYLNPRNVAAPSRLRAVTSSRSHNSLSTQTPSHPKASLANAELLIEYLPLECASLGIYCDGKDPSNVEMSRVTRAIFDEVLKSTQATVAVLFLSGDQDDPVVSFLRQNGVAIIDVRNDKQAYLVRDTIGSLDSHPGPVSHYVWYKAILAFIEGSLVPQPPS